MPKGSTPSTGLSRINSLTVPQVEFRYYVAAWPAAECPIKMSLY